MKKLPYIIASVLCLLLAAPDTNAATSTGLPVPRFVALKADEVNVRTGPGTRYPIQWVYHKQGMPVEVVEEYDAWRKIRDVEGTTGWVHKGMVDGKRNAIITGKQPQIVRIDADDSSKPILKVEPDVIARIVECSVGWCRIQVSGRKGWIDKKHLWGVYPKETIE
jgi:SH3-like domain-containing protein